MLAAVDVVFPVLHGPYGEDGTIQGLLELAGVPYVGAGVLASAAGMDKEFTKKLLAAEGLPIGDQVVLRPQQATLSNSRTANASGCRCSSSPPAAARRSASAGSRPGTSCPRRSPWRAGTTRRSSSRRPCPAANWSAACWSSPTAGSRPARSARSGWPACAAARTAFYDFATKYLDDAAELDVPAKIDDDVADEIRQLAIRAFRAIDCQGLARVDFFLTDDGPVINEINTMPGFTTISMYPRMWAASGVDYPTLLADDGRHRARARHRPALADSVAGIEPAVGAAAPAGDRLARSAGSASAPSPAGSVSAT